MSYRIEKTSGDIVFDAWGDGIASSPHKGTGDLRCADISTIPGEVMCAFDRTKQTQSKTVTNVINANVGTHVTALAGSAQSIGILRGTWITITSSNITNLTNGVTYYVKASASGELYLSTTYEGTTISNFSTTGTARFTVVSLGRGIAYAVSDIQGQANYDYFVLDSNGLVWRYNPSEAQSTPSTDVNPTWQLIDPVAKANATGMFLYGQYLCIVSDFFYYKNVASLVNMATTWAKFDNDEAPSSSFVGFFHPTIVTHGDNAVYIGDGYNIISLYAANYQPTSFNPSNAATYVYTSSAAFLIQTETVTALGEINNQLIVGCLSNKLYTWDKLATILPTGSQIGNLAYPLFLPENNVQQLVTVNNVIYVFCGTRGNVYITNGVTIAGVITVPDYVTQQIEPYYRWGGTMYLRGRIYFSIQDSNSKAGGIWSFVPQQSSAIEQDVGLALRCEAVNSYGTYAGYAALLFSAQAPNEVAQLAGTGQLSRGPQYWTAWDDGTSGASTNPYGIDFSATTPYTGGQTIVETDLVSTGEVLGRQKQTFSNIEFKLGAPLATGESVAVNYRLNLTDAWASAGTVVMDAGGVSGYITPLTFENAQWIQLQVVLTSTATTPSFVRLHELRLREN
jgi:hypothetical protein